ncbi:hypothetical protein pipiens_017470 [Culex pipiens pipiens]|uniref:Uncharacterized protein n=1 Tax=Culex pipiens pipiens TaxID=38569 RepID=A0ABD1CGL6_CULPP
MTLADLLAAMTEQFKLTQERIQAVNTSITEKIDSVKTELNDKLCAASRDIANFKEECAVKLAVNDGAIRTLNERVDEVSQEIGALENRNELIVSGVPYLPTENLADYFKAMWDKVGLNETPLPTSVGIQQRQSAFLPVDALHQHHLACLIVVRAMN